MKREKKIVSPHPSFPHCPLPSQGHGGCSSSLHCGVESTEGGLWEEDRRGRDSRVHHRGWKEDSRFFRVCLGVLSLVSYLQSHLDLTYCKCNIMFCFSIVKESENVNHSVSLTLCGPLGSSPPGYSVHGIVQARILEWVAIPFSRVSSQPRDGALVSCIACRLFIVWATREAHWLFAWTLWVS